MAAVADSSGLCSGSLLQRDAACSVGKQTVALLSLTAPRWSVAAAAEAACVCVVFNLCGMVDGTLRGTRAALVLIWLQLWDEVPLRAE